MSEPDSERAVGALSALIVDPEIWAITKQLGIAPTTAVGATFLKNFDIFNN